MENYTPFHVVKFKQTYQTTESTGSQERQDPDHALDQVITNNIQQDPMIKSLPTSSTNINCKDMMTLIYILFSK